jgi:hypothetical protein
MQNRQQGLSTVLTFIIVVVVAGLLGGGAYFGYTWWLDQAERDAGTSEDTPAVPASDPTTGWQTYQDTQHGFTVKFPPTWMTQEGTFPSTHGETLKDISFSGTGTGERVFLTIRTNPDGTLRVFVDADGVTNVQPAKVNDLDGFAATTADAYRVYLGKDVKVYMFTFPGARTNQDLSADKVNLLTSFEFTNGTSSSDSSSAPTASKIDPIETIKTYYSNDKTRALLGNIYTKRVNDCIAEMEAQNLSMPDTSYPCGIEDYRFFQDSPPIEEINFTVDEKNKEAPNERGVTLADSTKDLFYYLLFLENGEWRIGRIDLRYNP